jgi:cysteinyl-tRNA synthetase
MEKTMQEFFLNIKATARSCSAFPKWTEQDLALQKSIENAKVSVHEALCDNIDTRTAMFALKDLIGSANVYMQANPKSINGPLLKNAACYITEILRVFGVVASQDEDTFGFANVNSPSGENINEEEILLPYLNVLSEFREKVRITAGAIENSTIKSTILKECDLLRDEKLPELGVRLEDRSGNSTVVKYVGREVMRKEKEMRERLEQEREAEKVKQKAELLKLQQEKDAAKKIPPSQLFKREGEVEKYSQFDSQGIPTHDADGEPLTKSAIKKLQKLYQAQEKKYNDYLKTATDGVQNSNH